MQKAKKASSCRQHREEGRRQDRGVALGPVLNKLRGLINPLLRRVLSFAIGRLPAALQPAARSLASKFKAEAEAEAEELSTSRRCRPPISPTSKR